ncbi:glycosyltransferase family 2 protein [Angustibacter luteus]|uniref:Glycosyltransferase family A protein n=1 Tax=Angustibacter luteus TaxID=658456 RepID=A0ABW1JH23_9ACTN
MVKVSVIVPVYNPGPHLDRLLTSLDAQSMRVEDLELVFVDDGSTDDSPARLHAYADRRANTVVRTIPNSGWPGTPRNLGTDLAQGEYVFFADHDDEFFPESLVRMYASARDNGADIVYGKVVTEGMTTPFWPLSYRNVADGDLVDDHLLISRMTHKLFRRAFLVEHDIRFPERQVRLEDHFFMARAMPLARVISVVADYPCYRWVLRNDGTNNSANQQKFPHYWDNLAETVQTFSDTVGPGRVNDAALAWSGRRMLLHARPAEYLASSEEEQAAVVAPLYDLVPRLLPADVEPLVPVLARWRLNALRRQDRTRFDQAQEFSRDLTMPVRLEDVRWVGSSLELSASARLLDATGEPVRLLRDGDDLLLDVDDPSQRWRLLPPDLGELELTVRHRPSSIEWPLPGRSVLELGDEDGRPTPTVRWTGRVDPWSGVFQQQLEDGLWDVLARVSFLGEPRVQRLAVDGDVDLEATVEDPGGTHRAHAYVTKGGTLALRLSAKPAPRPRVIGTEWREGVLRLVLAEPADGATRVLVRRRNEPELALAPLVPDGRSVTISFPPSSGGQIFDLWLRSGEEGAPERRLVHDLAYGVPCWPPLACYRTEHGSFSVRDERRPATAPTTRRRPRPNRRVARRISQLLGRG